MAWAAWGQHPHSLGTIWALSQSRTLRDLQVAYSAPVIEATAVFVAYPLGQGSFSDGMPMHGSLVSSSLIRETTENVSVSFLRLAILVDHANNLGFVNPPEQSRCPGRYT